MYGTARIRALENRIVGREKLNALMEARGREEILARLAEYGVLSKEGNPPLGGQAGDKAGETFSQTVEEALNRLLRAAYQDVEEAAPEGRVFIWFRYPYDCNNLKLAIKCRIRGIPEAEVRQMLFDFGTVPPDGVLAAVREGDFRSFPEAMAAGATAAEEAYAKSRDPRQIDTTLDKACYRDMLTAAGESGDPTLLSWLKAKIDLLNAVICLRMRRMGQSDAGRSFLGESLLPGGDLPLSFFTQAYEAGEAALWEGLATTRYASFVRAAEKTEKTPADVERCADDCWMSLVKEGARISFGAPVLAGYLVGWEAAVKKIRMVLAAKEAGLDLAVIRERVGESYV
jgi:V/A-type H+-transporting ATPase subunit C